MIDRFILGSAQFGQRYGISNAGNIIEKKDVVRILDVAHGLGVRCIDTAVGYGDSERLLGQSGAERFAIVTKFRMPNQTNDIGELGQTNVGPIPRKIAHSGSAGSLSP